MPPTVESFAYCLGQPKSTTNHVFSLATPTAHEYVF